MTPPLAILPRTVTSILADRAVMVMYSGNHLLLRFSARPPPSLRLLSSLLQGAYSPPTLELGRSTCRKEVSSGMELPSMKLRQLWPTNGRSTLNTWGFLTISSGWMDFRFCGCPMAWWPPSWVPPRSTPGNGKWLCSSSSTNVLRHGE